MRDFGSKLADYEALADEPVMDLNSLESERTQFLRQAETEVNNDAEVDENDDDAVRCIPKVMQVSETFLVIFKLGFRSNYEVKVNRFVDHQKEGGMGKLKTLVVSNLNSPLVV